MSIFSGPGITENFGTAILNFGSTPQADADIFVPMPNIRTNSRIRAWIACDTTSTNNADSHIQAGTMLSLTASNVIQGLGFTITGRTIAGLTSGTFIVNWEWE